MKMYQNLKFKIGSKFQFYSQIYKL